MNRVLGFDTAWLIAGRGAEINTLWLMSASESSPSEASVENRVSRMCVHQNAKPFPATYIARISTV